MAPLPRVRNYIDGHWAEPESTFEPLNPVDQTPIAIVQNSNLDDVDQAVCAARRALSGWKSLNPTIRARYLHDVARVVAKHESSLARSITLEMGKTLVEATGEVQKLSKAFDFYAEEATRIHGETIPNDVDGYLSIVAYEPIGVIAAITPWNYPLELIGWKMCAALAAGCTIVVKPSEFSSLSAGGLFACLNEVGLPAGVVNLVLGRRDAGPLLVAHRGVDKIAFTGSTETGTRIAQSIPSAMPLSMELGGSCPMIVSGQADVDRAVKGAARRGFRNAGQICIAINRIYVEENVYEEFVEKLTTNVRSLKTGNGLDPTSDIGPMATPEGLAKVEMHIADARERGAMITTGGSRIAALNPGNYFEPTVVTECTPEMLIMHDETFGPAVGVMPYRSLDDAISWANGTTAGLAAYFFTKDLAETFDVGSRLDFGNVAVNNVDAGIMNAPYGGRKGSGYGYEHGREGLRGYLQLKHLRISHGE